jgi:hypothetical protein
VPFNPPDTFADGTWYLSVSYFNGTYESGFLPDERGQTYRRLDVAGGVATGQPPLPAQHVHLRARAGGVVRVEATYSEQGEHRADEWAISYTIDGTPPAEDDPDDVVSLQYSFGLELLEFDLPAQSHDVVVKVIVQLRRFDDPTWVYSEPSVIHTMTADAVGPAAPLLPA